MSAEAETIAAATEQIVSAVRGWGPVVVAIDGHGASGKTTLAERAAAELGAQLVHTDDYFRDAGAGAPDARPMARYYDWTRMRLGGIGPAIASGGGAPLLIEGVSSASPALADLVTRAVLVVTPESVRLARLHERISDAEWDETWLAEERRYFSAQPPDRFDLVVSGGS